MASKIDRLLERVADTGAVLTLSDGRTCMVDSLGRMNLPALPIENRDDMKAIGEWIADMTKELPDDS